MKTRIKSLIAAALAGTALFATLPASAHDGGWDRDRGGWDRGGDRGGDRDWDRGDRHEGRHDHWRHHRDYRPYGYVAYDRVVVRERPVYRSYYAPAAPVYYAPPRPRYADPSIVVGVSLPPLVIPLR